MFPWLHGVDGTSGAQNYFFGIEHHHYTGALFDENGVATRPTATKLPIPEHRGLMFVHASEHDLGRLVGSVSPSEILQLAPRPSGFQGSVGSGSSSNNGNGSNSNFYHNSVPQDINNHPQVHHQYSTVPAAQQQQQQQKQDQQPSLDSSQEEVGRDSDWADITDDSTNSSFSSSSLSSTTLPSFTNTTNATTSIFKGGDAQAASTIYSSSFLQSLSEGINIRNFKIQVPRYALLSDLIIYAKEGEQDPALLQLAKQISTAQDEVWKSMKEQYPEMTEESRRQTLILTDTFAAFETKYPELVGVTSGGKASRHKVDFWEQEREQMALLTRASEIAPGIWLGNNTDVPSANSDSSSLATPVSPGTSFSSYFFPSIPRTLSKDSSAIPSTPPPEESEYPPLTPPSFTNHANLQPSICVECRSNANAPTTMTLDRIKHNVACSLAPLSSKEIFHLECLGTLAAGISPDAFPPSASSLSSFARQDSVDVPSNHAMRRATAAGLVRGQLMTNSMLKVQTSNLINMAFFIHSVTNPESSPSTTCSSANAAIGSVRPQQHHQVLIHCVDGYTESALLALSVVMIYYRISLAEAYVKLQTDLGRSFFVYPNDAIMMLEVENQIWQRILLEKTDQEAAARWKGMASNAASALASAVPSSESIARRTEPGSTSPSSGLSSLSSSVSSSSSSFFSSLLNMSNTSSPQQQEQQQQQQSSSIVMEGIEPMPDRDQELAIQRPFAKPGHEERFGWFYHPEFEGSFPSRILPFLYLGNLAHASNPGLLKSLGIQYVLSVGEEAYGLDGDLRDVSSMQGVSHFATEGLEGGESDGGQESTGSCAKQTASRFMVKLVDDMFDNGVDSLWRHLENCVDFVDEARRTNARVLIHCRVGVSRSATIVIAYLMAHYNLSLVDAYLLVRARRLSVIIQPNLLFMYELLQWEQRLRGRFDPMGWPGIAKEVHSLNMYYIGN
ncbi:tyrosine/serine/threonine protein phosphatase pps1 [Gamsiella multidivaricata]|nr:tyrosine/serine/threonine protein phosphatase pps1 [Gamsiella multidivaricata]